MESIMFRVTGEGKILNEGFNFYPWTERKYSIGFRIFWKNNIYFFRWSVKHKKLIRDIIKIDPESIKKGQIEFDAWCESLKEENCDKLNNIKRS